MAAIVDAPKGDGNIGHRGLVGDASHVDGLETGTGGDDESGRHGRNRSRRAEVGATCETGQAAVKLSGVKKAELRTGRQASVVVSGQAAAVELVRRGSFRSDW